MKIITRLALFFVFCLTFSSSALGQITISSAYNPSIGDIYVYKIADTSANPGQSGSGVIWNLGTLPSSLNTQQYNWKDPANINFGTNFPSANIGAEVVNVSTGTNYEFYDVSGTHMKVVGRATGSAQ